MKKRKPLPKMVLIGDVHGEPDILVLPSGPVTVMLVSDYEYKRIKRKARLNG